MKGRKQGTMCLVIIGIMFLISAAILALLAGIIWKMDVGVGFISGGVIAVYVISCLFGGFCMGQNMGKHKFFWGLLIGAAYFGVLTGFGQLVYPSAVREGIHMISSLLICGVAGMLGGMLAPNVK